MDKFARMFLVLSTCLISVPSLGYMHTDEQLAKMNQDAHDLERTLDGFSKNLSGELPSKYKSLRRALGVYANSHADNELNAGGTGWADAVVAARETVKRDFIELFKKLDAKALEPQSESQFRKQDAELNRIYQALLKNEILDTGVATAPSKTGIKETQRKWITYRDAWLAFATLKFPSVSKSTLSAFLTSDRIGKLREITDE